MYKVRTQEIEVILKQIAKNTSLLRALDDGSLNENYSDKVTNLIQSNLELSQKLKKEFNVQPN